MRSGLDEPLHFVICKKIGIVENKKAPSNPSLESFVNSLTATYPTKMLVIPNTKPNMRTDSSMDIPPNWDNDANIN